MEEIITLPKKLMELIIQDIKSLSENYLLLKIVKPKNFTYSAGQWINLSLNLNNSTDSKIFSLASSPTESSVLLLCKVSESKFKKKLKDLKVGSKLYVHKQGGNFLFNKSYNSVYIAGGVGIAPFRSAIKSLLDTNNKKNIKLIYLNRYNYFPFKNEFEYWKKIFPNFLPIYIKTNDFVPLSSNDLENTLRSLDNHEDTCYYIAGPQGLIEHSKKVLSDLSIDKDCIIFENFSYND